MQIGLTVTKKIKLSTEDQTHPLQMRKLAEIAAYR